MNASLIGRIKNGLWHENPGLVQLLGLCPLLAVTASFVNALGLGLATMAVLIASNVLISAARRFIVAEIRIPVYVLIIASLVTCIEMLFEAFFPDLDRALGIFIPLIVTNCAIVARAEVYASRNPVGASAADGVVMGAGFLLLLIAIGSFREILGQGTLFSRMDMLFGGEPVRGIVLADQGWLLMVLPPGAFFSLALAIAARNAIDKQRRDARNATSRRARPLNR